MVKILILLAGFVALVYGAGKLVDSSSSLARRMGIPNIVIGLTIVAFGTSSPELLVSLMASFGGSSDIALGNVVGSNIFNILFILGISAIIYPLSVKSGTTWIEIPLTLLAGVVILIMANDIFLDHAGQSFLSRSDGLILLLFFMIFMVYNIFMMKKGINDEEVKVKDEPVWRSVVFIVIGLVLLVAGGRAIVWAAVELAQMAGISERIIGLTIVSVGTSLPEAATSIIAARRKNTDIAIGNIVGSNIFNIFLILGASSIVLPIKVNPPSNIDMIVNIVASLLLFVFIFTGKGRKIARFEGVIFLLLFLLYMTYLIFPGISL